MPRPAFTVRPAAACSRSGGGPHRWHPDGDSADLLAYGRPDHGVTVILGRCDRCGAAVLSLGHYGSDHTAQSTLLELPAAALPED
jgi:hypothetical protein